MVRKKNRYLIVQIQYADGEIDTSVSQEHIYQAIRETIKELYGDYGLGAYSWSLNIKYTNPYTGIFFLQCPRDYHVQIRTCITFIKILKKKLCVLTCLHVTATLRSAEKYLLEYNTKKMNLIYKRCKTPQERKQIMDVMKKLNIENVIDTDDKTKETNS